MEHFKWIFGFVLQGIGSSLSCRVFNIPGFLRIIRRNTYYNKRVVSLHSLFRCIVGSRGYHVYQTTWKAPSLTDNLSLKMEPLNEEEPHAVAVIRQSDVVGHIPGEIFRHVFWFIKVRGTTQVKELELKGSKKSIENQQQNKDPQHDTEDPQKDPPEVICEDQDVSDGEDLDSSIAILL